MTARVRLTAPGSADQATVKFRAAVRGWWDTARIARDGLPWRSSRNPWHVFVSETMLSQTQGTRVAERYPRMIECFPTPRACAAAPLGDVLRLWEGLGYYRRAISLHGAAQAMVDRHDGRVPSDLDELLALPGVGPYTARAVRAFAFDLPAAVVDTNVGRVIARAVAGAPLGATDVQALADGLVPKATSREWNLAVMDLGALVCTSRSPACERCPLGTTQLCRWQSRGGLEHAPDPSRGSAGVSKPQGRFVGSDRQGRGRIVRAACAGTIPRGDLARIAGWPDDPQRVLRIVRSLLDEGILVESDGGTIRLP